ncbi:energy-coupling factor transporter transmembrane component T family protein [Pseudooceanicola atlanticus]|uniref:Uncharacterized protein n=1 Tax=Pseudooceanicola atlanticus TaxID=1461694 RepID=A0A0A0EEW9_9RHOB|nr:energy-coupling factor transporter transmembrane component T [Pseudooceanicola atlanticus]KGM48934.1 hypothetical protein ATO9_09545 [Pseudooceanicola atlanticus]
MIGALSARPTPFHRIPAARKLLGLCVFCTILGVTDLPVLNWAAFGAVMLASLIPGRWFLSLIARDLKMPAVIAVFIIAFQWATGHLVLGLSVAGTLMACIAAAMVFSRTTSPAETLGVVDRGLARLRVPEVARRRLSLAVALTLRFIPALSARADHLAEAYRMRSPRRLSWRIVPPLALGALDEADQAAEAMRARAHTI